MSCRRFLEYGERSSRKADGLIIPQAQPLLQAPGEGRGGLVGRWPAHQRGFMGEKTRGVGGIPVYILRRQSRIPNDNNSCILCTIYNLQNTFTKREKRSQKYRTHNILKLFKSVCVCMCVCVSIYLNLEG